MIEKEEDLFCFQKHKVPVLIVDCDKKLTRNQRLLCPVCINHLEQKHQVMNFIEVQQIIEENQKSKKESIENMIEYLQKGIQSLKQSVIQQLNQLNENTVDWIQDLQLICQQEITYSFFDELEKLIKQTTIDESNFKSSINKFTQVNKSYNKKITKKIDLFKSFQESKQFEQILNVLDDANQINENTTHQKLIPVNKQYHRKQQSSGILLENQFQLFEQQLILNEQYEFKLIDNSNEQFDNCWAIAFDNAGSIMVSCDSNKIKIWNCEQGRLKPSKTYSVHTKYVTCLVYSKQRNNFISGSVDNTIISWKQINQKEWVHSQQMKQHSHYVYCLILNKEEDQLISGGYDKSIKVWKVDFIQNELIFLYSLDKHVEGICSFSINQSWHHVDVENLQYGKKDYKEIGNLNISKKLKMRDLNYISLMIKNLFGQPDLKKLMIYQCLNYRMEFLNKIQTKLSNYCRITNMKIIVFFQQNTIKIKIQYWQSKKIIYILLVQQMKAHLRLQNLQNAKPNSFMGL